MSPLEKRILAGVQDIFHPLMTSRCALFRHRGRLRPVRLSASHPSVPSASKRREEGRGTGGGRDAPPETAQLIRLFIQMRHGSQSITSLPVLLFKVWVGGGGQAGPVGRFAAQSAYSCLVSIPPAQSSNQRVDVTRRRAGIISGRDISGRASSESLNVRWVERVN